MWSQFQSWFASLHRSTHQRWIAGVAGGLSERFGIPHTVVRAGFVLATFVGLGVPLYLLAWVLLPDDTGRRVLGDSVARDAVAVAGLVVAGGWFLAELDAIPWIFGRAFPWLVILVGLVLLLRRGDHPPAAPTEPLDTIPAASPPPPPAIPATDPTATVPPLPTAPPPTAPPPTVPPTPFAPMGAPLPRPARAPRPPRPKPFVGPLTACAAVAVIGLVAVVGRATGAYRLDLGAGLAIAMVVIGAGLTVSSVRGRARGLLLPALVLGLLLGTLSALDVRVDRAGWPLDETISNPDDLPDRLTATVGGSRVDLADLRLERDRTLRIDQTVGSLEIVLPRDLATTVDVDLGTGVVSSQRPSARSAAYSVPELAERWSDDGPPAHGQSLRGREVDFFRDSRFGSVERRLAEGDRRIVVGPDRGPRLRLLVRMDLGEVQLHDLRWADVPERVTPPARLCTVAGGPLGVVRPCADVDVAAQVPLCIDWSDGASYDTVDCRSVDPETDSQVAACRGLTGDVEPCDAVGIVVEDPETVDPALGRGATVPPLASSSTAPTTAPTPTAAPTPSTPSGPAPSPTVPSTPGG